MQSLLCDDGGPVSTLILLNIITQLKPSQKHPRDTIMEIFSHDLGNRNRKIFSSLIFLLNREILHRQK